MRGMIDKPENQDRIWVCEECNAIFTEIANALKTLIDNVGTKKIDERRILNMVELCHCGGRCGSCPDCMGRGIVLVKELES